MRYPSGEDVRLGDEGRCTTTTHPEPVACRVVGFAEGQEWGLRVGFVEVAEGIGSEPADHGQLAEWRAAVDSRRPRAAISAPALWLGTGALGEPPVVVWACVDYARAADFVLLARGPLPVVEPIAPEPPPTDSALVTSAPQSESAQEEPALATAEKPKGRGR